MTTLPHYTLEFQKNILKQTDESNKYFWSAHDINISRVCQWKPKKSVFGAFCNFYNDIKLKKKESALFQMSQMALVLLKFGQK